MLAGLVLLDGSLAIGCPWVAVSSAFFRVHLILLVLSFRFLEFSSSIDRPTTSRVTLQKYCANRVFALYFAIIFNRKI